MKSISYLLLIFGIVISCRTHDSEKLERILNSDELHIQLNTYGGIGGYSEQYFHLKQGEHESIMIVDEGTDYQTFVRMDEKKGLLRRFLQEALATNNSEKSMSNSCLTGIDSEYIIKTGLTELILRPNEKCDSIFSLIIYDE